MVGQDRKRTCFQAGMFLSKKFLFQHAVFLSLYNNAKAHR